MADLAGVRAKLERAAFHAQCFQAAVDEALSDDPYFVTHKAETDGWYVFRWNVRRSPDLSAFPVIFGDILSNLRAALDHLAWQLVLQNGATPTDRTAFPCVLKEANWGSAAGDRLKNIDPVWIEKIRSLQPFNQGNGGDPARHLFAVLEQANNINKHRLLPPVFTMLDQLAVRFTFEAGSPEAEAETIPQLDGAIEDQTEAMRIRFSPRIEFNVDVDPHPALKVTFADGMDHSDGWGYTNQDLVDWVRSAIAVFEPAFTS